MFQNIVQTSGNTNLADGKNTEAPYIEINDETCTKFSKLVEEQSGLFFSPKKYDELRSGILKAFHRSDCNSIDDFFGALSLNRFDGQLFRTLVSYLTVNETYFFRHFDVLEKELLPLLTQQKAASKTLKLWSAGCASGEEAYTIAMVLHTIIPDLESWNLNIMATDINETLLEKAGKGFYRPWALRTCDDYYKKKYFHNENGIYRLDDDIKKMVRFHFLNLKNDEYWFGNEPIAKVDIIFCRNVTIYFELNTTVGIVNKFYDSLVDNGYLIVGHAEPSVLIYNKFKSEIYPDAVVYQKDESGVAKPTGIKIRRARKADRAVAPGKPKEDRLKSGKATRVEKREKPAAPDQRKKAHAFDELTEDKSETDIFDEGVRLFNRKDNLAAIANFQRVVDLNSGNARAYYLIAHIHANMDNMGDAKEWCLKALEKDPLLIEAYYLLALIHKEEQNFEKAIQLLKKVIYVDINFALGYYEIAVNYFKLGNNVLGRKNLDEAKKIVSGKDSSENVGILEDLAAGELLMMTKIWD